MYEFYQQQRDELLPLPEYSKTVSLEKQKKEIQLLQETVHFERFFFVLDLHELKLEHVTGVERWLGYPDKDFTILKFLQIIHPSHLEAHYLTASVLIGGLMRGDWKVEFMKHRYSTHIALRHSKGHFLLFKRLASVFQYDTSHRLLAYLNEFTLVKEFNDEPYLIGAKNEDGSNLVWMEEVLKRTHKAFENKNFFTFQELRILRKFAYIPGISASKIAAAFKIKENTVITHKKRILIKAEKLFSKQFETVKQLADHLKEQGLI